MLRHWRFCSLSDYKASEALIAPHWQTCVSPAPLWDLWGWRPPAGCLWFVNPALVFGGKLTFLVVVVVVVLEMPSPDLFTPCLRLPLVAINPASPKSTIQIRPLLSAPSCLAGVVLAESIWGVWGELVGGCGGVRQRFSAVRHCRGCSRAPSPPAHF